MSIWCSWDVIGYDPFKKNPKKPMGGQVRAYAEGWSNHYPTADVEAKAAIGLATIAPWCVPGHNQEGEDYACTGCGERHGDDNGDWIRVEFASRLARNWWLKGDDGEAKTEQVGGALVLDVKAARALGNALIAWVDGGHVTPVGGAEAIP